MVYIISLDTQPAFLGLSRLFLFSTPTALAKADSWFLWLSPFVSAPGKPPTVISKCQIPTGP